MAELRKVETVHLRMVRLEEVARYLECNPEKLRIALKHLVAVPSGIEYSKDAAVSINPAVRHVDPTPEEAAKAAAAAAWHVMAKEEMDKILLKACDRLDQAGGKGRNYSFVEMVASAEAERAAEKAAKEKVLYQALKPTFIRYHTMKSSEGKWLN